MSQFRPPQPEGVADIGNGTEAHGSSRNKMGSRECR